MGSEWGGWVPGRLFVVAFTVANLAGAATTPPRPPRPRSLTHSRNQPFLFGLACQGKDITFRFIIEYNSLMDFGP
jgi:hypothetical protein